jgi:hypothetical protein
LGPKEYLIGLAVRISAKADAEWMVAREGDTKDEERRKLLHDRGVKAGTASAKSPIHVSKQGKRTKARRPRWRVKASSQK